MMELVSIPGFQPLALLATGLLPALVLVDQGAEAPQENSGDVKITVYKVWASSQASQEDPPKEIEAFVEQLRKAYGKRSFRLEGKPISDVLRGQKALAVELPQNYGTEYTLTSDPEGKSVLQQNLVNPKKVQSVDLLKKSPAITHLEKIRQGEETFLLIVQFEEDDTSPSS